MARNIFNGINYITNENPTNIEKSQFCSFITISGIMFDKNSSSFAHGVTGIVSIAFCCDNDDEVCAPTGYWGCTLWLYWDIWVSNISVMRKKE